ncbi:hypothetical protein TSOC_005835 [Tetrabaena socialis]|uniref:Uncharacterized protein n=1 Tax=Tetrabaena socialis TaxID=47790 RepID=A0A2J8A571_9CHLO|nr:hypothetical protein TSOC_005835 [Tetrabaena socialis]|eukprot:PNH07666.1 hypothetical protein TSOC_005835 [Tetrabaena socialis]
MPAVDKLLLLRNITLIVPAPELALLLRLLQQAGVLPPVVQSHGSGGGAADSVGTSKGRRLEAMPSGLSGPRRLLVGQPLATPTCPHALLLSLAAASEVGWYTANTIFFRTVIHYGWSGRDVTVTTPFYPAGFTRHSATRYTSRTTTVASSSHCATA